MVAQGRREIEPPTAGLFQGPALYRRATAD